MRTTSNQIKMSKKKKFLLQKFIFCKFDLIFASTANSFSKLQTCCVCPRILAQLRNLLRLKDPKVAAYEKEFYTPKFRCKESDINEDLTDSETLALLESFPRVLTEKQLYVTFYHFRQYLIRCYNDMTEEVWKDFNNLLSVYQISEDDETEYWMECKKGLSRFLLSLNHYSIKCLYNHVRKRKKRKSKNFKKFLNDFAEAWFLGMKDIKNKWLTINRNKIINYNKDQDENIYENDPNRKNKKM
ncbi:RAD protein [Plasmodium malariae]|uniref:RAD protein n=2 Tax=Plasmodium malariae TaxID=5858 RepID=A0A1D3PA90_PLAMA|nr:RAD protein [Plasmodium malariae]SCN12122.1 RAD protein [Plasmodium malariae]